MKMLIFNVECTVTSSQLTKLTGRGNKDFGLCDLIPDRCGVYLSIFIFDIIVLSEWQLRSDIQQV